MNSLGMTKGLRIETAELAQRTKRGLPRDHRDSPLLKRISCLTNRTYAVLHQVQYALPREAVATGAVNSASMPVVN